MLDLKEFIFTNPKLGAKIIQRLDGFNDLKKMKNERFKIKIYLSNLSMNFIRKYLANKIIYQSLFVKERWEKIWYIRQKFLCNP